MNRILRLCLPLALGALVLGRTSIALGADPRQKNGGGKVAAAQHVAAPAAHIAARPAAVPHYAARPATMPHYAAKPAMTRSYTPRVNTAQTNLATRRTPTVNRSFANRTTGTTGTTA